MLTEPEEIALLARLKDAPTATVIQIHNALKARETELKAEMEAKLAPVSQRRELVSLALLDHLNRSAASSIKTPEGTVYLYTQKTTSIVDGDALWEWAKKHDASDVFQRRINQSAVEGHNEANPNDPVAGLHTESIISARVRAK
jgi:hypothetical protein